jgi:hypothetical protein
VGTGFGTELTTEDVVYCKRHPQVETVLRCGRCDTPICPRCLVQTPVGARCRECANVRTLPTVDVKPAILARGAGAALAGGAFTGAVWGYTLGADPRAIFFFGLIGVVIIALVVGWAVSEVIALATNRRRGPTLQACAVAGCIVAYVVHNVVGGAAPLPVGDAWGYIATAGAALWAASRLRY